MPALQLVQLELDIPEALRIGSVAQVIFFGDTDDDVHHIRETAAAAAAFFDGVIDLGRDHKLPGSSSSKRTTASSISRSEITLQWQTSIQVLSRPGVKAPASSSRRISPAQT
jgi:hypothetical protein